MRKKLEDNPAVEAAIEKFIGEFLQKHPKSDIPAWFFEKTCPGTIDDGDYWRIAIVAKKNPRRPLESNVFIDEESGEKRYVIADSYEEVILFEMSFKKSDLSGTILTDVDLHDINDGELAVVS
ncbi:hypothetical protein [Hahella sp. NBU794]|uniref:hypothetical protein n=1 Tax=Hahella sp. NBU794 TaxID=3422590 RepID=UPI003D6E8326